MTAHRKFQFQMAESGMDEKLQKIWTDLERVQQARADIDSIEKLTSDPKKENGYHIQVTMKVNVPNRSEVQEKESIDLFFPLTYPAEAPTVIMRHNFPTDFPHLNPNSNGQARPCIYEGDLNELLFLYGLEGYFQCLAKWLDNAAKGTLIYPDQGWEPIRYDGNFSTLILNTQIYIKEVGEKAKIIAVIQHEIQNITTIFFTRLETITDANRKAFPKLGFSEIPGILFPPSSKIQEIYQPNVAINKSSLEQIIADLFDVNIWTNFINQCKGMSYLIVLPIKRPFRLIGTDSDIEYLARIVDPEGDVTILRVRTVCDGETLQNLNGVKFDQTKKISLIGCGSLGSKIGSHLARMGIQQMDVFDKALYEPHNFARNALNFIHSEALGVPKAILFEWTHKAHGNSRSPHFADITTDPSFSGLIEHSSEIIETTGSLRVLRTISKSAHHPPSISSFMLNNGKYGIMLCEGPNRKPRLDELDAYLCDMAIDNPELSKAITANQDRIPVGLGCSSATAVISDSDISLIAAGVTAYLKKRMEGSIQPKGEIWLGRIEDNSMSIYWESVLCPEFVKIKTPNTNIRVRINKNVLSQMEQFAQKASPNETGGLVFGEYRIHDSMILITRIETAKKSKNSPNEYVLYPEGVENRTRGIEKATASRISLLGTWHSHPLGGEASALDKQAQALLRTLLKPTPALVVIWDVKQNTCSIFA